jgi:hypothetical protein
MGEFENTKKSFRNYLTLYLLRKKAFSVLIRNLFSFSTAQTDIEGTSLPE